MTRSSAKLSGGIAHTELLPIRKSVRINVDDRKQQEFAAFKINMIKYFKIMNDMLHVRLTTTEEKEIHRIHCEQMKHLIELFDLVLNYVPKNIGWKPQLFRVLQVIKGRIASWETQICSILPYRHERKLVRAALDKIAEVRIMCDTQIAQHKYLLEHDNMRNRTSVELYTGEYWKGRPKRLIAKV